MSGTIQTDERDFVSAIQKIANAINEIVEVNKNLKTKNEGLKSSWKGVSKEKY